MRIAQVCLHPDYGGCERHVEALADALTRAGHDVTLYCHPDGRLFSEAKARGVAVFPIRGRSQIDPRVGLSLLRAWAKNRPDIVHLHTSRDILWGIGLARGLRTPKVVVTRHVMFRVRPVPRQFLRRVDAIVCLADILAESLARDGLPRDKLVRIDGAIETGPFLRPTEAIVGARRAVRAAWGICETETLVGAIGRLAPGKGFETFLDAIALLPPHLPARFVVVGDGPLDAALGELAGRLPPGRVVFAGFRADMPDIFAALDLFVLASDSELLPLTIMEAQVCGVPVIASAVGGVPSLIDDEKTGWLVPPKDPEALAQILSNMLASPETRARVAEAARARAVSHHDFSRLTRETIALYESQDMSG